MAGPATGQTYYGLFGGAVIPAAPVVVGPRNVINSSDPEMVMTRTVDDTGVGNAHGLSDSTLITRSGKIGYNSFDGYVEFGGVHDFGHYAAAQSRPIFTNSGLTDASFGLFSGLAVNNPLARVSVHYGLNFTNAFGPGTVGSQRGVNCEDLTKGDTNYCVLVQGHGLIQSADPTEATPAGLGAVKITAGGLYVAKRIITDSSITSGDTTALIRTSRTMSDGASIQAATLSNAPIAGNPTKWLPIDDHGVTRYIPAW